MVQRDKADNNVVRRTLHMKNVGLTKKSKRNMKSFTVNDLCLVKVNDTYSAK